VQNQGIQKGQRAMLMLKPTRSSIIAEGPHDALVGRNLATTKHPIWKRLQLANDLQVYAPKVIVTVAFTSC